MLSSQFWFNENIEKIISVNDAIVRFSEAKTYMFGREINVSDDGFRKLLGLSKQNHHALIPLIKDEVDNINLSDSQIAELLAHHSAEIRFFVIKNYKLNGAHIEGVLREEHDPSVLKSFFRSYRKFLSEDQLESIHTSQYVIRRRMLWKSEFELPDNLKGDETSLDFNSWHLAFLNKLDAKKLKSLFVDPTKNTPGIVL